MKALSRIFPFAAIVLAGAFPGAPAARSQDSTNYRIYVSNEKSDDITVIDGATRKVAASIPVGKRPRGIHASADGRTLYVALSGTPVSGPPPLDAKGNPILKKGKADDDDDDAKADKAADGIGIVNLADAQLEAALAKALQAAMPAHVAGADQKRVVRKIKAGSDPEQFAVSADGTRLFVSNEDVGTASFLNIAGEKVEHIVPVGREPEGVGLAPGGEFLYVTCETAGDVFVISTKTFKVAAHFTVHPRPRTVDFLPDGSRAFIPSESVGEMNVVDAVNHKLLQVVTLPKGSRPMCVKVALDGKRVYVSNGRAGTISVMDAATFEVTGTIKVGDRPWGITFSPDGKLLFAANGPSDDISVVDVAAGKEIERIKCGKSPWGIAVVARGK